MIELPRATFELYLKSNEVEIIEKDGKYYYEDEELIILEKETKTIAKG